MPKAPLSRVANYLSGVAMRQLSESMSDSELLDRFLHNGEEAAFAAIIGRHGPMVRAVAARILGQDADADDAFQATFLVLLRRAESIRKRTSLASWLHGVARRVALRAKAMARREKQSAHLDAGLANTEGLQDVRLRELHQWLDRAVQGLPERFRACFVLCCLEGRSYAQAARQLGCAEGTVSSRVVRARQRLRSSFDRSGMGASFGLLAVEWNRPALPVAQALVENVLQLARQVSLTGTLASATKAGLLAKGVLSSMFLAKTRTILAVVVLIVAGTGLTAKAYLDRAGSDDTAESSEPIGTIHHDDVVNIPSRHDGILVFLGKAIRPGEVVSATNQFPVEIDGKTYKYRRLRLGDMVEKGEVIGIVDDALARSELKVKKAKVTSAEADQQATEKTRDESYQRWVTAKQLRASKVQAMSLEDVRGAELTYYRYLSETKTKEEAIKIAQEELNQAKIVLESFQIRSGVRGIVRRIHKHPGEAVRNLETVVTLQLLPDDE